MRPSPQALLRHAKAPLFLVSEPLHIRYLTGIPRDAGLLLVTPRQYILYVDPRFAADAERRVRPGIIVRDSEELPHRLRKERTCGFEADRVHVHRREAWKRAFPRTTFLPCTEVLEKFRRRKEAEELRAIRRAHRITRAMLRCVPRSLRPGVREEQLARMLRIWALERGADGLAFDPIVAFGTHTASPHHVPTSRRFRRGDLVQIDVGARVQGYCADMSEVFFTRAPTMEQARVYRILKRAQRRAMAEVRPGASTHALDQCARDVLREEGLEDAFCHALGHGVGLEIHEGVTLSQKRPEATLLAGEVITVEPGVYFPGRYGMRVEDMVYVS